MENENEQLNNDLNLNSLKRGKGRPFGKIGKYKPRMPKELKNNVLNDDEFNLINPVSEIKNIQLNDDIKVDAKPTPIVEEMQPIQENEPVNLNEPLNLDDLKNKDYVFQLPQTRAEHKPHQQQPRQPQIPPIAKRSNSNFVFRAEDFFDRNMNLKNGPVNDDEDDDKDRQSIINKLRKYQSSFKICADININYDGKTSYLKGKLEDFRNAINNKNTHAIVKTGYLTTVKGLEFVGCKGGMKLYGL